MPLHRGCFSILAHTQCPPPTICVFLCGIGNQDCKGIVMPAALPDELLDSVTQTLESLDAKKASHALEFSRAVILQEPASLCVTIHTNG